jgi:hypothetical protein
MKYNVPFESVYVIYMRNQNKVFLSYLIWGYMKNKIGVMCVLRNLVHLSFYCCNSYSYFYCLMPLSVMSVMKYNVPFESVYKNCKQINMCKCNIYFFKNVCIKTKWLDDYTKKCMYSI